MGVMAWVMMGIALWHFMVFLPDRCWAGIIGGFLGCLFGALLFGLAIHGFTVPGRDETDFMTAMEGVPGAALGFAFVYWIGVRQENAAAAREAEEEPEPAT